MIRLEGGKSVHITTALLLQLLQASAFGAISRVEKVRAKVTSAEAMGADGDKLDLAAEVRLIISFSLTIFQEAKICSNTIDAVFQSARSVAAYLFQRASASKATKTSVDADYKAILDTLVTDLLVVLYRPEWPVASLFLNVISRLMVGLQWSDARLTFR